MSESIVIDFLAIKAVGIFQNSTEIVPVILHAIGHVLGLDHSNSPDSIMYPIFEHRKPLITDRSTGVPKLNDIDIVAIRQLYGERGFFHYVQVRKITFLNTIILRKHTR